MSEPTTIEPQTLVARWLEALGFKHGNPFATNEADQERALLPECFVPVDGYERIRSERTTIVFAPRGAGKSALRVMLASEAAPLSSDAKVLAVEYIDHDALLSRRAQGLALSVNDYIPGLMRAALTALLDTLCGDPERASSMSTAAQISMRRIERAAAFAAPMRYRFAQLLRQYYPALLAPDSLFKRVRALSLVFDDDWLAFEMACMNQQLRSWLAEYVFAEDAMSRLLADLNDSTLAASDADAGPVERIAAFAQVARAAGLNTVEFLVDRIDEYPSTADDPQVQADMLEPLLAHLRLMELPDVAFKFFLSREARDVLLARPTIRRDRLTNKAITLEWDEQRLKHLLDARLAVYSDDRVHGMIELCEEVPLDVGRRSVLLGEWIESEMLKFAQRSPRRLLIAGQHLCEMHVQQYGSTGRLKRTDWQMAKAALTHEFGMEPTMPAVPLLRWHTGSRTAYIGERSVSLTDLEYLILKTLAERGGECERSKFIELVWGDKAGIMLEAANRAMNRLRTKLGGKRAYLSTRRGRDSDTILLTNYRMDD